MVHVAIPKPTINQLPFRLVQYSRQLVLRAHCPNIYTMHYHHYTTILAILQYALLCKQEKLRASCLANLLKPGPSTVLFHCGTVRQYNVQLPTVLYGRSPWIMSGVLICHMDENFSSMWQTTGGVVVIFMIFRFLIGQSTDGLPMRFVMYCYQ